MTKFFTTTVFFVAFFLHTFAQQSPVLAVGEVISVAIDGHKIILKTENAFGEISVYTSNTIRVRLDKKQLAKDFSYAVVAQPQNTKANITQNTNEISITTDSLKVIIAKKPFAVTFYTLDGKVINQDEVGLSNSWVNDEVTAYKHMQKGERFVGLGEKVGNLDRAGNGYTNWNYDAFGYSTGQDPLYASIPFYIGIHSGLNYGIFLDNTYQTDFNFGASNNRFSSFSAQGGELNYYFIYHKQVADIVKSYTDLTGRMKMPPLWSLGYQQNRYSYYPETEVFRIAQTLREKKIPADGITLDIHYMDQYKLFTWDKERFPDPGNMTRKLKKMGFRTTVIVDPGIKVEEGYSAYEDGVKQNIFVKYPDGKDFAAQVWPGWCHFPDFTSPLGRNWWKEKIKFFAANGVDGIWNDMNEIASWGQKMPSNILFNYDGALASHKQAHNVYGLQMTKASFEGAIEATNKRPFNLTRAGFAGLQRYTAIWTGDNRADEDHMLLGVRLLNSLGLSGVAFTGMDIGGFTGNPSVSLYAKWMQIGAFNPYLRNHTAVNTKSSEPWAFGEEVTEIARNYISLRYKLLPYLYATFHEATLTGMPVVRSLVFDEAHNPKIYDTKFQNQFLFGRAFMVAPFESTKDYGAVYLPKGKWYNLYTDEVFKGDTENIIKLSMQQLPVFVKEGSIVPMQSLVQTTAEKPTDTLIIHAYKGDVDNAFTYYEDDGESYDYEAGKYYKREILHDAKSRKIIFKAVQGSFQSHFKTIKIVFHGVDKIAKNSNVANEFWPVLNPISRFDPQGGTNPPVGVNVKTLTVKNTSSQFEVSY